MVLNVTSSKPAAPTNLSTERGVKLNRVLWEAGTGDIEIWAYEVYRHTADNFAAASMIGVTQDTFYDDVNVVVGTTYYYWVVAVSAYITPTRSSEVGSVSITAASEESLQIKKSWSDQSLFLNLGFQSQGFGEYVTPTDGAEDFLVNEVLMNGQPVKYVLDGVVDWDPAVLSYSDDRFDVLARLQIRDTDDLSEPMKFYTSGRLLFEGGAYESTSEQGSDTDTVWNVFWWPQLWVEVPDGQSSDYLETKLFKHIVEIPDGATVSGFEVRCDINVIESLTGLTLRATLVADDGTVSSSVDWPVPTDADGVYTFGGSTEDFGLASGDLVGSQWNTNDASLRLQFVNTSGSTATIRLMGDDAIDLKPHFTPQLPKVTYERLIPLYGIVANGSNGTGGYTPAVEWGSKLFNIYYDFETDELPPIGNTAEFRIDFTSDNWAYPDTQSGSITLSSGTLKIRQRD